MTRRYLIAGGLAVYMAVLVTPSDARETMALLLLVIAWLSLPVYPVLVCVDWLGHDA